MSCSSCGTKSDGGCAPAGCKSNGSCATGGCNALNVYDWFKDMELPGDFIPFGIVEVRYKGSRKEYYRNPGLELYNGDYVCTEGGLGFDIGTVSATGEIVRLQLRKMRIREDSDQIRNILRKATERDLEKFEEIKARENATLERARTIAFSLNLAMKISDIELQGDGRKVIFFYTAEQRVDFRELIRRYADEFRVKIEMRHISYREEASRLGGIGVCGRTLCCSTWLTDYKMVTTGAARVQNLSINMEKLAGQCGRLKCCLNYELDMYMEAVDEFPKAKVVKLETEAGVAYSRKTDILKRLMWFSYEDSQSWVPLKLADVKEWMGRNKNGEKMPNLTDMAPAIDVQDKSKTLEEPAFIDNEQLMGEDREMVDEMRRQREQRDNNKNRNRNRDRQRDNRKPNQGGPRPQNAQNPQNPQQQQNRPPQNRQPNRPDQGNRRPPRNENPQNRGPRPPRPDNRPPRNPDQK
ncbi:MAG: hypothetical protein JNL57_07675 [Bacteroidetes bacterium]|nr:hypothetical protein [Bacteroidota bacterium]